MTTTTGQNLEHFSDAANLIVAQAAGDHAALQLTLYDIINRHDYGSAVKLLHGVVSLASDVLLKDAAEAEGETAGLSYLVAVQQSARNQPEPERQDDEPGGEGDEIPTD